MITSDATRTSCRVQTLTWEVKAVVTVVFGWRVRGRGGTGRVTLLERGRRWRGGGRGGRGVTAGVQLIKHRRMILGRECRTVFIVSLNLRTWRKLPWSYSQLIIRQEMITRIQNQPNSSITPSNWWLMVLHKCLNLWSHLTTFVVKFVQSHTSSPTLLLLLAFSQ